MMIKIESFQQAGDAKFLHWISFHHQSMDEIVCVQIVNDLLILKYAYVIVVTLQNVTRSIRANATLMISIRLSQAHERKKNRKHGFS